MANFSDDDSQVDAILGQRKRKGALEYLVRWRGDGDNIESWESALSIGSDYAKVIQNFLESKKSEKKRSTSRSRKVSRSRSRSSSRNRKSSSAEKSKSRSRSRGRPRKSESVQNKEKTTEEVDGIVTSTTPSKNTRSRKSIAISDGNFKESAIVVNTVESISTESKSNTDSNNMAAATSTFTKELEVQRVHNERCLVRDDDKKSRSLVWRVADYAVIVLFILSFMAALFLFLEKIVDLKDFKSQAFPNMETLKTRLTDGFQSLYDSTFYLLERLGDLWLYLTQQPQKTSA
ncbi:chromobox protein homolog 5-like [Biomphalaria glabrata]|uniref:Chromobox protein homolog 5-like n=1 Tax=Biomphalaria glabrata TaxID=6526 RepID=A0A9W3AYG2_BIOGL|nr:chromobox protein homolog 5-like [Biomphalaria glabrata]